MEDKLPIQLNHEIQNLIHASRYRDPDDFGVRLARRLAAYISDGTPLAASIGKAIAETKTLFFRANHLTKDDFGKSLVGCLRHQRIVQDQVHERLAQFCSFAERQLAAELWANRNDEAVVRSHLQTFLEAAGQRTLKEVVTGRGRADIARLDPEAKEVIETKLWKGEEYFREGLTELAEYLRTEHLDWGHYIVLDFSVENKLVRENGIQWTEQVDGRNIRVYFIRIAPLPPSKLRRGSKF